MKHDSDALTNYEFQNEHSACSDQDDVQLQDYGIVVKPREEPIAQPQEEPVPDVCLM